MRHPEQLTIGELQETWTVADFALYGGLTACGFALGFFIAFKLVSAIMRGRE